MTGEESFLEVKIEDLSDNVVVDNGFIHDEIKQQNSPPEDFFVCDEKVKAESLCCKQLCNQSGVQSSTSHQGSSQFKAETDGFACEELHNAEESSKFDASDALHFHNTEAPFGSSLTESTSGTSLIENLNDSTVPNQNKDGGSLCEGVSTNTYNVKLEITTLDDREIFDDKNTSQQSGQCSESVLNDVLQTETANKEITSSTVSVDPLSEQVGDSNGSHSIEEPSLHSPDSSSSTHFYNLRNGRKRKIIEDTSDCDEDSDQEDDVCKTMEKVIRKKRKPFTCSICEAVFTGRYALVSHLKTHPGENPYVCNDCGAEFAHKHSLHVHERNHTGEKPFLCNICGTGFTQSSVLKSHMRIHTGEKPYECRFCDARFIQSSALVNHERGHTGEKPYTCENCGTGFPLASSLKMHEKTNTKFDGPFSCIQCGEQFKAKCALKQHQTIVHPPEKFLCRYCDKHFFSHKSRYRHEMTVHSTEMLGKLHECSRCGAKFEEKNALRRHREGHKSSYQCRFCAATFSKLCRLEEHRNIHTGEKPFECSHCEAKFAESKQLKLHNQIHDEKKIFECKHCGGRFARQQNVRRHEREVHGIFAQMQIVVNDTVSIDTSENSQQSFVDANCENDIEDNSIECEQNSDMLVFCPALQSLEKSEEEEKLYFCKLCDASFTLNKSLKCHENTVHQGYIESMEDQRAAIPQASRPTNDLSVKCEEIIQEPKNEEHTFAGEAVPNCSLNDLMLPCRTIQEFSS